MTIVSFNAPTRFARYIQLLVMKYGGYFVHNPYSTFPVGISRFKIEFRESDGYRKFMVRVDILNQPFV